MKFNKNEEAVSPVIGVILMVAITVILAAVIAVFVFGMADDIQSSHSVAATAKVSNNNVLVTFQGGADATSVKTITSAFYDNTGVLVTGLTANSPNGGHTASAPNETIIWGTPLVGQTVTIIGGAAADRVVVTADFDDNTKQILLDKKL